MAPVRRVRRVALPPPALTGRDLLVDDGRRRDRAGTRTDERPDARGRARVQGRPRGSVVAFLAIFAVCRAREVKGQDLRSSVENEII